ncbi:hypothetical protein CH373_14860 [Leptospira perolatii]|uniref:Uncharacterized protein n=1 Tax=Leptospira perolatii TaxID=2023191 RepID=A0A2M9ZKD9_9LEPT|nr:hypothetical protein [Leptospira perolatii]PJZ69194.1 hypothetical protein CH360_11760 [Leptospira perolatii]PJZ72424.1 hypothetical protein CH373_14860 [Leptospira perolatii]
MAKGYHSRSPEEFQEFLKQNRERSKDKSKTRLILFIDLILLMFILAVVARIMNPLAFTGRKESNQASISGIQVRVSSNREGSGNFPVFFLFMRNQASSEISFPESNLIFQAKVSTNEGLVCFAENWEVPARIISPGKIEFFRFQLSEQAANSLPPECLFSKPSTWNRILWAFGGTPIRKFELDISSPKESANLKIDKL